MQDRSVPVDKIPDPRLRELAAGDSDERVTVLIQPNIPQRRLEVAKITKGGVTLDIPVRVEPESLEEREFAETGVAEASAFLEELLGASPRWLRSARSFAAGVTPEQLRVIAGSPTIKAVWPNREHRRPLAQT